MHKVVETGEIVLFSHNICNRFKSSRLNTVKLYRLWERLYVDWLDSGPQNVKSNGEVSEGPNIALKYAPTSDVLRID